MTKHLAPFLVAGLVAAAVLPWSRPDPSPPAPPPAAAGTGGGSEAPSGAALRVDPRLPEAPSAAASAAAAPLLLPDGTTVPALNGAVGAVPLARAWSPHVPYSPIVGRERSDAGIDWYVHADGTRSTTEMKYRPDLGRPDAVTRVAHPGPAPPPAAR